MYPADFQPNPHRAGVLSLLRLLSSLLPDVCNELALTRGAPGSPPLGRCVAHLPEQVDRELAEMLSILKGRFRSASVWGYGGNHVGRPGGRRPRCYNGTLVV